MDEKIKMFVFCSSAATPLARKIEKMMQKAGIDVMVWNKTAPIIGSQITHRLRNQLEE